MFAPLLRHRYWTLGAVLALLTAGLMFAFATNGSSTHDHHPRAAAVEHHISSHDALPPVSSIQDQLKAQGYKLAGTSTYDSSDAHRTIHGETWTIVGDHSKPIVFLTDAYPGKPGMFVIDDVSYGQTAAYKQFWCVPPTLTDAGNLTYTISAAASERTDVQSGLHKPERTDVTGTDMVNGTTLCYMK